MAEPPDVSAPQFVVRNTFIERVGDEEDDEDDEDGLALSAFRTISDPTSAASAARIMELEAAQRQRVELEAAEAPAGLVGEKKVDVGNKPCSPKQLVHSIIDQADEALEQRGQPRQGEKSFDKRVGHEFVIRKKNTFVDLVDEEDEDEGCALSDFRSVSDPTGRQMPWGRPPDEPLHVLQVNHFAMGGAPSASAGYQGRPAAASGDSLQPLWQALGPISFVDREGDTTTLKAPGNGALGYLELVINGERHDEDVRTLEFKLGTDGYYSVFMQGMGAVVVEPPPGPQQRELCRKLLQLAKSRGVPVFDRGCVAGRATGFEDDEELGVDTELDCDDQAPGEAIIPAGCGAQDPCVVGTDNASYDIPVGWQWGYGSGFGYGCYDGMQVPQVQVGPMPPFGFSHCFHSEVATMGNVSADYRQYTKAGFEGRLSVVSESVIHTGGIHRFLVQFTEGPLSKADGVGFVFSPRLPCKKNIQRIVSVFVNQRGRICMRICEEIIRASAFVKPLRCGDWVEMSMDLDQHSCQFAIWPKEIGYTGSGSPTSTAEFAFGRRIADLYKEADGAQTAPDLNTGHLACVVKNVGLTVTIGS